MKRILIFILTFGALHAGAEVQNSLGSLPVQDAGRVKPFDTFAREALQLVYGRQTYNHRPATAIIWTWMMLPSEWEDKKIIQVRHNGLREALKLDGDEEIYRSPKELFANDRLSLIFQELRTKQARKEKLDPYFQAVQRLNHQISMFHGIRTKLVVRVVPSSEGNTWTSVAQLDGELKESFDEIFAAFSAAVAEQGAQAKLQTTPRLAKAVADFKAKAKAVNPESYANEVKLKAELHYNHFHPFQKAWISYLIGALFLVMAWVSQSAKSKVFEKISWVFLIIGFLLHTYGMGLRIYITGRPPVSNMYETVIWVPWGAMVFAGILEAVYRYRVILLTTSIGAVLCLVLSDMAPAVLDASLHPLEPVLRDNFWLVTHVLIITISYAAFFVAFLLGDLLLLYYYRDEHKYAQQIGQGAHGIYRAIQIGVVLLAAGIILGGIWADYSWGRFWGWDPKETWALIALLGYVAMLHGRIVGWLRNFGMAVYAVVGFSLVIMAWYGVNFVLGAGLHTYGFGAGGVEYVAAFVALHLLFAVFVTSVRNSRRKAERALNQTE